MGRIFYSCIFLLSAVVAFSQDAGFRLLPEVGHSFPSQDFNVEKAITKGGLKFGLHAEKMWGKFGVGLYGGIDKNGMEYDDLLPASNPNLNITRSSENNKNYFQQLDLGIGPIVNLDLGQKFNLDISSKLGFSKVSYPDFREFVTLGDPVNQQYQLFQTKNEALDGSLQPM